MHFWVVEFHFWYNFPLSLIFKSWNTRKKSWKMRLKGFSSAKIGKKENSLKLYFEFYPNERKRLYWDVDFSHYIFHFIIRVWAWIFHIINRKFFNIFTHFSSGEIISSAPSGRAERERKNMRKFDLWYFSIWHFHGRRRDSSVFLCNREKILGQDENSTKNFSFLFSSSLKLTLAQRTAENVNDKTALIWTIFTR